jgi:hypothetical protein
MKRRKRLTQNSWSNKNFHISIYLMLVLFTFALAGAKYIGVTLQQRYNPPVIASDKQTKLISPVPVVTTTPPPTTREEYVPAKGWSGFVDAVDRACDLLDCKEARTVIKAQGHLESGWGNSNFCIQRYNCLGIGAVDHDPNNAWSFDSYSESIFHYVLIIKKNFRKAWENRDDKEKYLYYLRYENDNGYQYATDDYEPHDPLKYEEKIVKLPEWNQ